MLSEPYRSPSPGFVLLHDYLVPLCLTPAQLGEAINASTASINAILDGAGMTDEVCVRLADYFGTSPHFWTELQALRNRDGSQASMINS